jgi:hypothetical protein
MPAHQTGISLVGRQILGNGYHSPPGERHDSELHGQAQLDSSPGQYPSFTAESLANSTSFYLDRNLARLRLRYLAFDQLNQLAC